VRSPADLATFVAGLPLSSRAVAWGAEVHAGQERAVDGAPFMVHPLEVALLLQSGGYRDEVVAAGLLHDVVEKADVRIEAVAEAFGDAVADIVAALTEDEGIGDYDERKAELRDHAAAAGDEVLAVFAADKVVKAYELRLAAASDRLLAREVACKRAHYLRAWTSSSAGCRPTASPAPCASSSTRICSCRRSPGSGRRPLRRRWPPSPVERRRNRSGRGQVPGRPRRDHVAVDARFSSPHRLLVVEDDPELRSRLRGRLDDEGFEVTAVADGSSALEHVDDRPDAVVIDLVLPDADGRDLCRALRARGCAAPVLFLAPRDMVFDRMADLGAGGDDYVTKPVALDEVVARLGALLRRGGAAGAMQVGALRLDPVAHAMTDGTREVSLTPTEFRLLGTLASQPGAVIRRRDLVRTAWPEGAIVYDNTLDQYIARLRRKLRGMATDAAITTVRGVGYRLD
jgi:DNA-binding response OmpR family regulator